MDLDLDAAQLLPDTEKEALALALLEEFGASRIRVDREEIHHSCLLPFGMHKNGDRSASASLSFRKLTYNCFVCGGGGLLWFIATMRGETSQEARKWLRSKTGLSGTVMALGDLLRLFDAYYSEKGDKEPDPSYNPKILEPWKLIHPYLTEAREIPVENLIKFQVGWDSKINRIIIPHFVGTTLVGWQSRKLDPNDPDPMKYKNTPRMPKNTTLYNYDYMATSAVVVESPMSVLRHAHHVHMEATFGAEVSDRQIQLMGKHPEVILMFDNDKAGWKATGRVAYRLARYTKVRVVDNPFDADAADFSDNDLNGLLQRAVPPVLWEPPKRLESLDELS